jgi:hypothetical protein
MLGRTLVLLELIEISWSYTAYFLPESINLSGYGPPEDLIKHSISHVIVSSTLFMFGNSKSVLVNQYHPLITFAYENSLDKLVSLSMASDRQL